MDISGLDRVQDDLNKFMVPFGQFSDGMDKSLLAVYLIKPSMSQKPEIRSLFGLDAFQAVSENIYQGRLVELLGKVQDHFQFSARLSDRIPVKVLERPSDRFCLDEMAQLVLDDVLESVG